MSRLRMPKRMYTFLFDVMHWYAKHVLKVPFTLSYTPPPDHRLLGITYAWEPGYVQRVLAGLDAEERIEALQQLNEQLMATQPKKGKGRANKNNGVRDKEVL